jgi:hypothetical protein
MNMAKNKSKDAESFTKIVQDYWNKRYPGACSEPSDVAYEPCPDQRVSPALFMGNGNGFRCAHDFNRDKSSRKPLPEHLKNNDTPRLIIILESPHKDEFKNKQPIGPALSKTGNNICNLLHDATRHIRLDLSRPGDLFELLLVNAIQHQCSLGQDLSENNETKDKIFDLCWRSSIIGEEHLKNRLKIYISGDAKRDVIINACTNPKKSQRKDKIDKAIKEVFQHRFYRLSHPSSWHGFGFKVVDP